MKYFTLISTLLSALLLTGCATATHHPQASDQAYYMIDTHSGHLCQQHTHECISLSIIASQNGALGPVEKAYQQTITGPNYPRSLMNMLLAPKDGSYVAQPYHKNDKRYTLPRNTKTDIAWHTLNDLYSHIYDSY